MTYEEFKKLTPKERASLQTRAVNYNRYKTIKASIQGLKALCSLPEDVLQSAEITREDINKLSQQIRNGAKLRRKSFVVCSACGHALRGRKIRKDATTTYSSCDICGISGFKDSSSKPTNYYLPFNLPLEEARIKIRNNNPEFFI